MREVARKKLVDHFINPHIQCKKKKNNKTPKRGNEPTYRLETKSKDFAKRYFGKMKAETYFPNRSSRTLKPIIAVNTESCQSFLFNST